MIISCNNISWPSFHGTPYSVCMHVCVWDFLLIMCRRSVRIQDNELRDLAEKIRQANQLKEREDSEVLVVDKHLLMYNVQGAAKKNDPTSKM